MISLGQYALAMQGAQFLEFNLGVLWSLIDTEIKPREAPPKNLAKAMGPIMRRVEHAFQKASASDLHRRLEGKIDSALHNEIGRLIKVRDRLAHRYLREQYALAPPIFGDRMFQELQDLAAEFDQLNARIREATETVASARGYDDDLIPGVAELAKRLVYGDLE
jgi:hypothetical protein